MYEPKSKLLRRLTSRERAIATHALKRTGRALKMLGAAPPTRGWRRSALARFPASRRDAVPAA